MRNGRIGRWRGEEEEHVLIIPHIALAEVFSLNNRATGLVYAARAFAQAVVVQQQEEASKGGPGHTVNRTHDRIFTQAGGAPLWCKEFLSIADPERWADGAALDAVLVHLASANHWCHALGDKQWIDSGVIILGEYFRTKLAARDPGVVRWTDF